MTWQARESGSGKESHSQSQVCRQCTAQPPSLPPTHTPPSQSLAPKQKGRREFELLLIKDAPNWGGYQSTVFGRYVYFGRRMPRDTIPALRKLSLVYTQRSCPQFVRKCVVCSGIVIHVHIHITVCSRCNSHVNARVYGEHCRFSRKKVLVVPLYLLIR